MLGKSRIAVFSMIRGSGCSKSRLAKAACAEVAVPHTPLWREARFQAKMHKTPQLRTNFWSSDVEKISQLES